MAKLPDFKHLSEKLDLDSLVSNVKQMINPEDQMPHPDTEDKLGQLIAECSALAHDLWREHEEFAKHNEALHIKLNQLFKELHQDPKVKESAARAEAAKQEAAVEEAKAHEAPANEPEAKVQAEPKKPEEAKAEEPKAEVHKAEQKPEEKKDE